MAYRRASDEIFIEGTIKTVARIGIENMRTRYAAEYAGFTEATMYRRFPSKEILLRDAFLFVDQRLSDILLKSDFVRDPEQVPFEQGFYTIWSKVFRYLIDHKDETLFLIRYRYSSLYTGEIREMRQFFNGRFEPVYAALEKHRAEISRTELMLLLTCIFDITLGFAEKVIAGNLENSPDTEESIRRAISGAVQSFIGPWGEKESA